MPPDAGGREIGAQAAARHITVRACLPPRVEKEGKMRSAQIEIEGIGAARAVEKLVQGGVPVLGAKLQKKGVLIQVDAKHCKKVFAILRGSCYNVKKVSFSGWRKLLERMRRYAGLLVGTAVFAGAVLFCQSRVLRVEVVGSGACYTSEVLALLAEDGTGFFSPPPEGGALTARILALPRVSFCSLHHEGGVLTVQVELSDDALPLSTEPLYAPADGVVYALTVVAGRALVAVGDSVRAGDVVAENGARATIAGVTIAYAVDEIYSGSEDSARAQAYLAHGEIDQLQTEQTGSGWRITGEARVTASRNLG